MSTKELIELLLLSVAFSMDAFAVSICKGLSMKKGVNIKQALLIALFFGGFQAIMPLIGYFLCRQFEVYITAADHWIAFGLLAFLGGKMLFEVIFDKEDKGEEKKEESNDFKIKELFLLSIATSIDALAGGITLAVNGCSDIWLSVGMIGLVTFLFSMVGVFVGSKFGAKFEKPAQIVGGSILILLGIKILLEHLGVIGF